MFKAFVHQFSQPCIEFITITDYYQRIIVKTNHMRWKALQTDFFNLILSKLFPDETLRNICTKIIHTRISLKFYFKYFRLHKSR